MIDTTRRSRQRRVLIHFAAGAILALGSSVALPAATADTAAVSATSRSAEHSSGNAVRLEVALEEMDRIRKRLQTTEDDARRERLLAAYRDALEKGMTRLPRAANPRVGGTEDAGVQVSLLRRQNQRMQRLVQHLWTYIRLTDNGAD